MSYVDELSAHQRANALGIIAAVKKRGWPQRAAVIAVETALTESGMRVLASANVPESVKYPHDLLTWTTDGLGHDHASIGMYQQQTGTRWALPGTTTMTSPDGWGTPAELMDAETSTSKFLNALARVDWQHMANWVAAQAVQHSRFSDGANYAAEDTRAQAIVAALWNTDTSIGTGTGTDDSTHHQILGPHGGRMFAIIRNQETTFWYAYAPGYWHRFGSPDELAWVASSPLCVNRADVKRVLASPGNKPLLARFSISNAHTVQLKRFALGG